eukprot:1957902-Pleurochrysis_carterae.AAC.1
MAGYYGQLLVPVVMLASCALAPCHIIYAMPSFACIYHISPTAPAGGRGRLWLARRLAVVAQNVEC